MKFTIIAAFIFFSLSIIPLSKAASEDTPNSAGLDQPERIMEEPEGTPAPMGMLQGAGGADRKKIRKKLDFFLAAHFVYAFPFDNFFEIAASGYGGAASFRIENLFVNNYFIGINFHYNYFKGKGGMHHASILPITAQTGYRVTFWRSGFIPFIGIGGSYTSTYPYRDSARGSFREKSSFDAIIQAGALLDILVVSNYYINLGADFCTIFQKNDILYYSSIIAGLSFRF